MLVAVFSNMTAVTSSEACEVDRGDIWARIARNYAAFGSPLVPCAEDIRVFENVAAVHTRLAKTCDTEAVMLGMTPGIAQMRWPPNSKLLAVDKSEAVIRALWPGDIPGVREAICAPWSAIPRPRRSCDMILGDGSFIACKFPEEVIGLLQYLGELLKEGGAIAIRYFVRPNVCESVESVFDALLSSQGMAVDAFKMRLWTAMQRTVEEGVAVRDAAQLLDRYMLDSHAMQERLGWSRSAIEPFAAWSSSTSVYHFPTIDELLPVFRRHFEVVSVSFPKYELGNCAPTLVMRKTLNRLARSYP
jgi:hypothetical protein